MWTNGFLVGIVVGVLVGAGLAALAAVLRYNAHCGQVPLFGGTYCR